MILSALWSVLAKLLAALAVLTVVHAPMASALHAEAPPETVCVEAQDAGPAAGEDAGHEGHDHAAHGCGTCHVHLIGPDAPRFTAAGTDRSSLHPLPAASARPARPSELFRPPRI
jgi:hypothetical protein